MNVLLIKRTIISIALIKVKKEDEKWTML